MKQNILKFISNLDNIKSARYNFDKFMPEPKKKLSEFLENYEDIIINSCLNSVRRRFIFMLLESLPEDFQQKNNIKSINLISESELDIEYKEGNIDSFFNTIDIVDWILTQMNLD